LAGTEPAAARSAGLAGAEPAACSRPAWLAGSEHSRTRPAEGRPSTSLTAGSESRRTPAHDVLGDRQDNAPGRARPRKSRLRRRWSVGSRQLIARRPRHPNSNRRRSDRSNGLLRQPRFGRCANALSVLAAQTAPRNPAGRTGARTAGLAGLAGFVGVVGVADTEQPSRAGLPGHLPGGFAHAGGSRRGTGQAIERSAAVHEGSIPASPPASIPASSAG
jgi:hypothetical protein